MSDTELKFTFLALLLKKKKVRMSDFARAMGWSHQRVEHLTNIKKCQGFPFKYLNDTRHALRMSEREFMDCINVYFAQLK